MGALKTRRKLLRQSVLIGLAGALQIVARTQGAAPVSQFAPPAFDAVSIHTMKQEDMRPEHITNPYRRGYLLAVNVNLKSLMEMAYDIPDLRMFGGPTWLTSEKFSIEAKADPSIDKELAALSIEQAREVKRKMIAMLLVQRFNLVVHSAAKDMPVYAMVVAKAGPKLVGKQSEDDSLSAGDQVIDIRPGNDSLQILAYELSWRVRRPVLNQTGLQENKALTLRWRDDESPEANSSAPSLFTAIQEQLGLKLESTRGTVPVLLIDRVDKPTEN